MGRSQKKPMFITKDFFKLLIRHEIYNYLIKDKKVVFKYNSKSRSNTILNFFKKPNYLILDLHKGLFYKNYIINKLSFGHKFGEFAFTRKPFYFTKKEKKSKNLIKR